MVNVVESVPLAVVDASLAIEIPLQLTGTVLLMGDGKSTSVDRWRYCTRGRIRSSCRPNPTPIP